jgi:iron complex outermembrane receptor protein
MTDPKRGNEPLAGQIQIENGGNENLRPEKSRTFSLGAVWKSCCRPIRVSADWTRIATHDGITNIELSQETLLNEDLLPAGVVTRAPAGPGDSFNVGPVTGFNARQLNVSRQNVETVDLAAELSHITQSMGTVSFNARATHLAHLQSQLTPSAPHLEDAGQFEGLRWKANAQLGWSIADWHAGWVTHYVAGYFLERNHETNITQGSAKIGAQVTHDVFVRLNRLPVADLKTGASVQIGVENLFNRAPPFQANSVVTGEAKYGALVDPRKAVYYVMITANLM